MVPESLLPAALVLALAGCPSPGRLGFTSEWAEAGVDAPAGFDGRPSSFGFPDAMSAEAHTVSDTGTGASEASASVVDTTPACDLNLAIDGTAEVFAKALGICTSASTAGYGLVSASYTKAFGGTDPPHVGQWGMLTAFGSVIVPREGHTLGILSSGYARQYDDSDGVLMPFTGTEPWEGAGFVSDFVNSSPDGALDGDSFPTGMAPPGFPRAAAGCPQSDLVNDMIDLKLVLKAPEDASAFSFDLDFYSSEWPNFVCSDFNDAFVAYLTSKGTTGNVSFDPSGDPIAVNTSFLNRCTPNTPVGCQSQTVTSGAKGPPTGTSECPAGPSELLDTGFGDTAATACEGSNKTATLGGSTGWLTTAAPINPGEQFTLEFMIWDAGDGFRDSSVLLDNFQWLGGVTVVPSTVRSAPK